MMSSSQNGATASRKFKWQWRNKLSLSTRLLNEAPPEIELSDYHMLPSSGSESPSGLLNGEGLKVEPIADLDLFFERLYSYYCEKGLWCIIVKWIFEMLTVIFVTCFIGFFLLVVDWQALRNAKCGLDAFETRNKTCDLANEVINHHPLSPFTFSKGIIIGSMVILTIYGLFNFAKFIVQFRDTVKVRNFYYNSLNVTDREIQTTPWPVILDKVVRLQHLQQLCVVKDLSAHDVVMRIMRKENYLIGMLNRGVLAFPVPWWIPGVGPAVNSEVNGLKNRLILTKTLEWTFNWCIFQGMFDNKFLVQKDFLANPALMKKRLMIVGICILLLSPCLVIFMLVYLFLRHAEQFYHHPSTASSRRWSNLSKWIIREFNEVEHLFQHRINSSIIHASNYLKQFPTPIVSLVAKFVSFVSGGFAAILIIIAFLDESLLEGHIFGRNLFWYAAVFGTVTAISRAAISDDLHVLDPQGAMSVVVQHTHYMPKRWRGRENSDYVRREFETLFQYTGMLLLEEMVSIFLTPFLLIFVVPKRIDDILHFISDFTVYVDGVGHVCSLSLFDFENHGNKKYGSSYDAQKYRRSSQGKMEKSFLSFRSAYPTWEPAAEGQQFLSNLRNFSEKQMRREAALSHLPLHWMWRGLIPVPNIRGEDRFSSTPQESHYNIRTPDPSNPPYLLDWYYVCQPLHAEANSCGPPSPPDITETEQDEDPCRLPVQDQVQVEIDDGKAFDWELPLHRELSHLEASTAPNPFFKESILQHCGPDRRPGSGNWWARPGPPVSGPQASFLDPPAYGRDPHSGYGCDPHSDVWDGGVGSVANSDGSAGGSRMRWGSLSRTHYVEGDSSSSGEFEGRRRLPFVDGGPLRSLPVRIIPRSNDPV